MMASSRESPNEAADRGRVTKWVARPNGLPVQTSVYVSRIRGGEWAVGLSR